MIGVLYPSNVRVSSKSTNQVSVHVDSAANSWVGVNDDRNWRSAGKLRDGPGFSQLALQYNAKRFSYWTHFFKERLDGVGRHDTWVVRRREHECEIGASFGGILTEFESLARRLSTNSTRNHRSIVPTSFESLFRSSDKLSKKSVASPWEHCLSTYSLPLFIVQSYSLRSRTLNNDTS